MWQYEACFLTTFPDRCGVIKWTSFRYRAECETKKARSRKGERAEEAYLMLLPDLFFSFGGGHRFLCDDKGIGEHWEYFNIECEANFFRVVTNQGK